MAEAVQGKEHVEQILEIMLNLGNRHLSEILEAGLLSNMVLCFGRRELCRRLHPTVLSLLAAVSGNDRARRILLEDNGRAYTLILEIAVSASDFPLLQTCISILSKMGTKVVPESLLRTNCVLLVAYIDKLLKTGPDGLVLHGLMQLQDYLKVEFLAKAFREHHCQRVVEILAAAPYKSSVRYMAGQVLQILTGVRSRRTSVKDEPPASDIAEASRGDSGGSFQQIKNDSSDEEDKEDGEGSSLLPGQVLEDKSLMAVAERLVTSALADATNQRLESSEDVNKDNSNVVDLTEERFSDETENTDEESDVDVDVGVQVNIIDATDDENSSLDANNNGNDDSDDDFEIISVNDHDYVNI
ncbi:hypothetical protein PoB_006242600 [Plakobranchus ocellatus]|uniref:Uncharacterized protein n=1 Tax=Plakobranchus ocellatus TaxID=259542 RepID=A0AAV4CVI6_9GAST|nr:hypothetical protein PoB_006242600 [Plakobranchus ocellatus]